MSFVAAKCISCGAALEVDDRKEAGFCIHCGTAYVTQKAIHHHNTFVTKNILGKTEADADDFMARGETFLKLNDWVKATEAFIKAAEIEPGNYKTWLGLVRCETKNFTDYGDTRHIEHYRKALAVASIDEKQTIEELCGLYIAQSRKFQAEQLKRKNAESEQEFLKTHGRKILYGLLAGAVSLVMAVAFFCSLCLSPLSDQAVAKNEKLPIVQATMLEIDTSTDQDGRHRIRFSYMYNGQTIKKWTEKTYSVETAKQYEKQGYLEIRISKSGRAVDIKYRTMYARGYMPGIIMTIAGAACLLFILIFYPKYYFQYRSIKKVMKSGREGTAEFLESVPYKHMYKIRISYKDESNLTQTVWTKNEYNYAAMIAAKDMVYIPMKYCAGDAILIIAAVDQYLQANKERLLGK